VTVAAKVAAAMDVIAAAADIGVAEEIVAAIDFAIDAAVDGAPDIAAVDAAHAIGVSVIM
jgi:hypothetical protein